MAISGKQSTRIFDIVGIVCVVGWLVVASSFTINKILKKTNQNPEKGHNSQAVKIKPGTHWRVLARNEKNIGYTTEARTVLKDGWLLERTQMVLITLEEKCGVKLVAQCEAFYSAIKAQTDKDGVIRRFSIKRQTLLNVYEINGVVEGKTLTIRNSHKKVIAKVPWDKPLDLEAFAHFKLANKTDWKADETMTLSMLNPDKGTVYPVEYKFVEKNELDSFGIKSNAMIFAKKRQDKLYPIAVDASGTLIVERLPFDTFARAVPQSLGRATSSTIQRTEASMSRRVKKERGKLLWTGLLEKAQEVSQFDAIMAVEVELAPFVQMGLMAWRLPTKQPGWSLESDRQRLLSAPKDGGIVVATANWQSVPTVDFKETKPLPAALESTETLDQTDPGIKKLVPTRLEDFDGTSTFIFEKIESNVAKNYKQKIAPTRASDAIKKGSSNAQGVTMLAVTALRASKIPARFVYGLSFDNDNNPSPHIWLQAWNKTKYADFDLMQTDERMQLKTLQIFTSTKIDQTKWDAVKTLSKQVSPYNVTDTKP